MATDGETPQGERDRLGEIRSALDSPSELDQTRRVAESWDALDYERSLSDAGDAVLSMTPVVLGRYVLLDRIGRGGGGVVFGAYDPELHRRIAVKVLHPEPIAGAGSTWTDRLLGEAQAIAKLSHPNIVAVYDVGRIPPGHAQFPAGVFLVMELVGGETLASWAGRARRPWREVLDVLLPIARALQAAHAAGLVHRDVKPGNVLLGTDGRARLVDFGLARPLPPPVRRPAEQQTQPDNEMSGETSVLGTPRTMAPEQHLGRPADARTDQYGFCVTLHAALHGEYPYGGDDLEALLCAKQSEPPWLARREVPGWLNDVIARGLAFDPERRYPDMDALAVALERGRRRRRLWSIAGGIAAGTTAIVLGGAWLHTRTPALDGCVAQGETRIEEVWGGERRATALAGLQSGTADTAARVDADMSAFLERWRGARKDACVRAFEIHDEPSHDSANRLACLDRVLGEVDELGRLLRTGDEQIVKSAVAAATQLGAPEECAPANAPGRTDPELDLQLRRARLHLSAGKVASAEELAMLAAARAAETGNHRASARAHMILCTAISEELRHEEAVRHCEAATVAAEHSGDDLLAVRAILLLARSLEGAPETERLLQLAEARVDGLAELQADSGLLAEIAFARGRILSEQHRIGESAEALETALQHAEEAFGPDDARLMPVLNNLGIAHHDLGRLEDAEQDYERALELMRREYGPRHIHIGAIMNNLAGVAHEQGRHEEALELYEQALQMKVDLVGADSLRVVSTLQGLARVNAALGRYDQARISAEQALAIDRAPGDEDPRIGASEVVLAEVLQAEDRCEQAWALLDHAEPLLARGGDPDMITRLHTARGRCAARQGDLEAARTSLRAALERTQRAFGADARENAAILLELADVDRRTGDDAAARVGLVRAQDICRATEGDPAELERVAAALAALR